MSGPTRSSEAIAPPAATITGFLWHWAETTPDAPALTAGPQVFTYAELRNVVADTALELRDLGIARGDRVVLVGHNTAEWVFTYLATLALGAIAVPANTRLSPSQFAAQAEFVDAALIVTDRAHAHLTEQSTRPQMVTDADGRPFPAAASVGFTLAEPDPDAPAVISFTSGTTGMPKGATLSHRALTAAARVFADVLQTDATDSTLVMVPLFHNTGFVDQLGHMLTIGGRTDLLLKFKTTAAIEALCTRPTTYITAVPSILRLLMVSDAADAVFGHVRTVLYGGSPMPEAWSRELAERWPRARAYHGYGLTEFTSAVSFLTPDHPNHHRESVGTPAPGVRVRIVIEDGTEADDGAVGELLAAGPTRMTHYWGQPELTEQKIAGEWLRTGDLAHRSNGLLYLDGRIDDVINRGGEKILPAYVESQLSAIPAVAEACVFPLPDPVLQQRVHAAVRLRNGSPFQPEDAQRHLSAHLPDYAVPETIAVLDDLPRGASGKVDRRAVARLVQTSKGTTTHA